MAYFLCLETSTEICSVALAKDNQKIALKEDAKGNSHSEKIIEYIDDVLSEVSIAIEEVDAVSVSQGPGSYTGLRIGISTAKGLCFALNKPLIAIDTLKSIAWGMRKQYQEDALYCPMIDARRMEVYCSVYNRDLEIILPTQNKIIDENSFAEFQEKIIFGGNAVEKCKQVLKNPNFVFSEIKNSAEYMVELSYQKWKNNEFEDVAYFEPFYLKSFIAGKSHVKGL